MGRVIHFEIPATEPEVSMNFYKEIFGWNFFRFGEFECWMANTGADSEPAINGAIMKRNHPQQPVTNNIKVADIDEAMQKVQDLGGTIVVPKTPIPGVGYYSFFKDPDNNILGMMMDDTNAA